MPSIKIKDLTPGGGSEERKAELWGYYASRDIKIWKLHNYKEFLYLITDDIDLEKFISEDIKVELNQMGFEIFNPPEINAAKTVVLYQLDRQISGVTDEELRNAISTGNPWAEIEELVRLGQAGLILKLRFTERQMAERTITEGIFVMHQHVPPRMTAREAVIKVNPCTTCYKWTHFRHACPTKNLIICNKCAREGHRSTTCRSQDFRCINCQGDHPTLAYRCPIRKQLIRDKKKEEIKKAQNATEAKQKSYAGVVQPRHQPDMDPLPNRVQIKPDALYHIMSAMVLAQMGECWQPGSFQSTLDQCYEANQLPKFKVPQGLVNSLGLGRGLPGGQLASADNQAPHRTSNRSLLPGATGGLPPVTLLDQTHEDEVNSGDLMDLETELETYKRKHPDSSGESVHQTPQPAGASVAVATSSSGKMTSTFSLPPPLSSTPREKRNRATNPAPELGDNGNTEENNTNIVSKKDKPKAPTPHPQTHRSEGAKNLKLVPLGNPPVCLRFLQVDKPVIFLPTRMEKEKNLNKDTLLRRTLRGELLITHAGIRSTEAIIQDIQTAVSMMGDSIIAHKLSFKWMESYVFDQKKKEEGGVITPQEAPEKKNKQDNNNTSTRGSL